MPSLNRQFWLLPVFAGISLAYAGWSGYTSWFFICAWPALPWPWYRARNWRLETVTGFRTAEKILRPAGPEDVLLAGSRGSALALAGTQGQPAQNPEGPYPGQGHWPGPVARQRALYLKNLRGIHQWENVGISSGDRSW